ncbi:hypothetical protein [Duganella radicis]|uniref:Uncharacterized protein n=1 Tax=Duganella radicis TaxID=551988 RepID=A0A6L6PQX1_9BURK|nr:hypothetical protein [Duganella radicis]MTV41460.1 hypothetical protein [Duganella radicis]
MAINVEDYGALDTGSGRRRLQTDARQGRWLYELEHAMLQGAKKAAPQDESQREAALPDESPALPGERKGEAGGRRAQHDVDDRRAAPTARSGVLTQATPLQAAAPNGVRTQAPVQEPSQQKRAVTGGKSAEVGGAGVATKAVPRATAAGALLPGVLLADAQAKQQQQQPAIPPVYLAAALPVTGSAGIGETATAATGATRPATAAAAALKLSLANARPAASQPGAVAELVEEQPPLPGAQPEAHPNEEYAQRLLHIYRDGAEVQAWVRDAALTQSQTQALAQNLAGELGSTGAQLAALTVNGRRVSLGRAEKASPETDAYMNETAQSGQESSQRPVWKINENGAF